MLSRFQNRVFLGFGILVMSLSAIMLPVNAKKANTITDVPAFGNEAFVEINGNVPGFSEKMIKDAKSKTYESYEALDKLGRCGVCVASIDQSLMPTEDRGAVGSVKPTGWQTVKYNDLIEGNYLYNRCHLIGYQLTAENANKKNLITGTRYLNVDGMLDFENQVASYLKSNKNNKVLYRVTPIFEGSNLVASGVQMEALSLNDNGESISFNVYCYNVQPGVIIDYKTGSSKVDPNYKGDIKGDSVKKSKKVSDTNKKTKADSAKAKNATSKDNSVIKVVAQTTGANQPVVEQPTVTAPQPVNDGVAWLSATGEKYHSINNCGRMNPTKATKTTISAAQAAGYDACSKCW